MRLIEIERFSGSENIFRQMKRKRKETVFMTKLMLKNRCHLLFVHWLTFRFYFTVVAAVVVVAVVVVVGAAVVVVVAAVVVSLDCRILRMSWISCADTDADVDVAFKKIRKIIKTTAEKFLKDSYSNQHSGVLNIEFSEIMNSPRRNQSESPNEQVVWAPSPSVENPQIHTFDIAFLLYYYNNSNDVEYDNVTLTG